MTVNYVHAWYLWRSEEDIRAPGTGVTVMWVLRIEHRSSRRTARTLNPQAISPAPTGYFSVAGAIPQSAR